MEGELWICSAVWVNDCAPTARSRGEIIHLVHHSTWVYAMETVEC